ncbi:MAG: glycosyltransferase family 2 protein [Gammaproteobacteria bacterium]|nr:glycosyltransferase family 2 protein [Gammaproteobacteria bacterium]
MSELSIVLIVKNEQEGIEKCLQVAQTLADELIVLDAGSEDDTQQISLSFGAKVYENNQWPGYGKQRQIAQSYATKPWVMMLDADEILTAESVAEIKKVVKQNDQDNVYFIPRSTHVFGRFIHYGGWYPDFVARLYPREKVAYNDNLVHEKLLIPTVMKQKKLTHPLLHYSYKDMNDYLVKSAFYAKSWADQRFSQGKKTSILNAALHAIGCFTRMYIFRLGFLDGKQGLILALLSSHSTFVKYIDLWSRYHSDKMSS